MNCKKSAFFFFCFIFHFFYFLSVVGRGLHSQQSQRKICQTFIKIVLRSEISVQTEKGNFKVYKGQDFQSNFVISEHPGVCLQYLQKAGEGVSSAVWGFFFFFWNAVDLPVTRE